MASRVPEFGNASQEPQDVRDKVTESNVVNDAASLTSEMINEAVDSVLQDVGNEAAAGMRELWSRDANSEFARQYFADSVRNSVRSKFTFLGRKPITINENLNQVETTKLVEYAPEYELVFKQSRGHDHGLYSARRKIDHAIIQSNFPSGVRYLDIGGNVVYHVEQGHTDCVVVAPFSVDGKDAMRHRLMRMRLQTMLDESDTRVTSREMARSVLERDGKYHVAMTAQNVCTPSQFSMACHVYDVPIQDWPKMMDRCGINVHEGCLHFSNDFFYRDSGPITGTSSYYEIDHKADRIRMRVGETNSSWYEHVWSDYMRYGADQIMYHNGKTYSYRIVQRRDDTIFYRILRLTSDAAPNVKQVYRLPDVPHVEVLGFAVNPPSTAKASRQRARFIRKRYLFPATLWARMVDYSKNELERGAHTLDKAFNYYRTIVPRISINGVIVSGGEEVDIQERAGLVVMSTAVAYFEILHVQRTIRAKTNNVDLNRFERDQWTVTQVVMMFFDAAVAALLLPISPLFFLSGLVNKGFTALHSDMLIQCTPVVSVRSLNMALLTDTRDYGYETVLAEPLDYRKYVREDNITRLLDTFIAAGNSKDSPTQPPSYHDRESYAAKQYADHPDETSSRGLSSDDPGFRAHDEVSWSQDGQKRIRVTKKGSRDKQLMIRERRMAIQEAIRETEVEMRALEYTCARFYNMLCVNHQPDLHLLRTRQEETFQADIWRIKSGYLVSSFLGEDSDDVTNFDYSCVFVPVALHGATRLIPVIEVPSSGNKVDPDGKGPKYHLKLLHDFTGFALVCSYTKIFNGYEMVRTLKAALDLPDECFEFDIVAHQGPAGCGKTTAIVQNGDPMAGLFMSPGRKSTNMLRRRLEREARMDPIDSRWRCRTLDSYLVNLGTMPPNERSGFSEVMLDEYRMVRAGKWYAALAYTGTKRVHAYGDKFQLNHKPRVDVGKMFLDIDYQILNEEFLSFRCAPRIWAAINYIYSNECRSTVATDGSIIRCTSIEQVRWSKNSWAISMQQVDKKYLRQYLDSISRQDIPVNTTHEVQGEAADQIVLYNGELRKRGVEDVFYQYCLQDYCLVAMTRARVEFVYVKLSMETDLVTDMMERTKDPRRVAAVRDISTQGRNIEFL